MNWQKSVLDEQLASLNLDSDRENAVFCMILLLSLSNSFEKRCKNCGSLKDKSSVAQWKRAGLITQRSVDRNYSLLLSLFFLFFFPFSSLPFASPLQTDRMNDE